MRLIFALTEQLGGTISYLPGSGTAVEVRFPARPE
jgi:two-component sensor histidine kinase